MTKVLAVIDMQNDFIDGSLGSKEAQAIVENVVNKVYAHNYDELCFTQDTHFSNYLETQEINPNPEGYKKLGWVVPSEEYKRTTKDNSIIENNLKKSGFSK